VSRSFQAEEEATAWEAKAKVGVFEARQQEARLRETRHSGDTLAAVLTACMEIDWQGKDQSQAMRAERLVKALGQLTRPANVTAAVIDDMLLRFRSDGLCNGTINRYLSALRVMLLRAQRLGLIDAMPLFPEARLLKEAEPRSLVLPEEWLAELLDDMERRERRLSMQLTLFLWHMGCRVSEALSLSWDRVDLQRNRITFVKTKGNKPRSLPIPEPVKGILRAMEAHGGSTVFGLSYKVFRSHYAESKHAACDKLRLSDDVRREWVVHTLRHTCLTRLAQKGWSAPAICQWAGHGSLNVTQRYVHGSAINLEQLMEC
jgi:integrase